MNTPRRRIYADHAATTPLAPEALEAMLPFLTDDFANPSSRYSLGRNARNALQNAREQIAECIGAKPDEIFFTSGGSESDNWAVKGMVEARKTVGQHIITSQIEHHAVLNACRHLEAQNDCQLTLLEPDAHGRILPEVFVQALQPNTACVSVMLANNELGTIEDIPTLSSLARERGIPFHTDAVQAIGHIPVDVGTLGVDALSASAHKFNGPKGVGFLYIRHGLQLFPLIDGGQQESSHRAGTENLAGIVGMATALKLNCEHFAENTARLECLTETFRQRLLAAIPAVQFNGASSNRLPGHLSLSIPGISAESLLHYLDLKSISVSTGAACNTQTTEISHVLRAIHLPETLARGTLRITFGSVSLEDDPEILVKEILRWVNHLSEQFPTKRKPT